MPCPFSLLERGAVCLALYPFTAGFPAERVLREAEDEINVQLERHESIDAIEAIMRPGDPPPELVVKMKLRRVLLLQGGTDAAREDIAVARINSISEPKRRRAWYSRLKSGIHPAHLLIGAGDHHGTAGQEAYVDLMSITSIRKAAILRRTGLLTDDEMRDVSERILRVLEVDISAHLSR